MELVQKSCSYPLKKKNVKENTAIQNNKTNKNDDIY